MKHTRNFIRIKRNKRINQVPHLFRRGDIYVQVTSDSDLYKHGSCTVLTSRITLTHRGKWGNNDNILPILSLSIDHFPYHVTKQQW